MFSKESRSSDGVRSSCKACISLKGRPYREATREQKSEYDREYGARNSEVISEKKKSYRLNNLEKLKAYRESTKDHRSLVFKIWAKRNENRLTLKRKSDYAANPEKYLTIAAQYRLHHGDVISAYKRLNKEKIKAYWHKRRARQMAGGSHSADDVARINSLQRFKCAICKTSTKKSFHIDHVMPLSKGGSNDAGNIQLLCAPCNLKKSAKHPIDYMQQLGYLL